MSIEDTFKAIRQACSPNLWSRAVELVRLGAVTGVSADEDEVLCRVRSDQHVVALNVSLFPEDEEWDCNCKSKMPCCEHVAAAIIALKRARQEGAELPGGAEAQTKLLYRFKKDRTQLLLERCISKADGVVEPLTRSVANIASSAVDTRRLTPTQQDLAIDRLMGSRLHGPLSGDMLRGVLLALAEGGALVELEGARVRVSGEPIAPVGLVEDDGKGVRVVLEKNPSISELVVPGVVLAGDALHVLAEPDVTGASLERLPSTKSYKHSELAQFVTEVLPELSRRFKIEVKTTRLPKTTRAAKPRVVLDVVQEGGTLSVLATLVYGDPAIARIDAGQLVHLAGDIPVRDEDAERREIRRLREKLNLSPGNRLIVNGDAAAELAARLDEHEGEIRGTTPGRFIQKGALTPSLRVEGGAVALDFALSEGGGRADGRAVIAAWQAGMSLVPLSDGGWAPLPSDFLARHGHKVADLLAHKAASEDGELGAQWLPQVGALCDELGLARPPEVERLAPLIDGFQGIPRAELPARLTATLRDYQRQGVDWLCFLRDAHLGATLADDMGLGKTLQALCAVRGRTLVVCPRSVVHNWQAEIRRFRPDLRVSVFHGARRSLDDADITLTTYALLRIDQDLLASVRWDTLVLDEAQMIKNPDSQVARAAYRLPGEFRVSLSGTPVENRLEELWSQFQFTNPGLLGGRQYFQDQYAAPIAEGRPDAAAALRSKIRPFLLRRLKSEVARELPPRTDMVLHCELAEDERAVYDAIRAATQKEVVEQLRAGGSVLAALESLLRLRQAACHSALIPGRTAPSSSKVVELCAALEQAAAEGHKSLVFSQWTSLLDLIEPHLTALGLTYLRLDGSTQDRQAVVDGFQSKSGPPVLLLSLKAGGTGLNLTEADHVFLMDPWWNPAVEDQAADRAHRIGQERPVFVYRLVAKDTVEERILALQEHKRSLADAALGEADRASGLTRDDLLSLLE